MSQSNLWTKAFSIGRFLLSLKGAFSITLLFIIITNIYAIQQSIEQQDSSVYFRIVGQQIINHDTELYLESENIINSGGVIIAKDQPTTITQKLKSIWNYTSSLGGILASLWYMYFLIFLFYRVIIIAQNNDSAKLVGIVFAIISVAIIQMFAGLLILTDDAKNATATWNTAKKMTPYKGFAKFIGAIPYIIKPLYGVVTMTQSENTTIITEQNTTTDAPNETLTSPSVDGSISL